VKKTAPEYMKVKTNQAKKVAYQEKKSY